VIDAADHRVMAFGGNARAEAHEFVDVAKATDEQVLGDDRDAVGHTQHRRDEWFVVGRHTRIRQRRDVTGPENLRPLCGDARTAYVDHAAHRLDLSQQHLHVLGMGVDHAHLAAGDESRGQVRRADHAVGHDVVTGGTQLRHAIDGEP